MSRLIACPASFALAQQVTAHGGGGSSIYAATGTVAHALAEEALTDGYDPASQLDETVEVDGFTIKVDTEMVDAVRVYVQEVQDRAAGATWFALETRVCLDDYWSTGTFAPPSVSAFGTADTIAYHGTSLHMDVVDYKNGAGVFVDVTDNPQLNYYAAGALREILARDYAAPVTIDLTIVQPNVRGAEKVRTFRTSTLDVLLWVDDVLKPTIAEAMAPGARIAAGKHCRFCPARANCPALNQIAQDLARRDFGPSAAEPVELTPVELGELLRDMETVGVHVDAQREVAQASIEAGVPVPGWSLVPSRPVRGWTASAYELVGALHDAGFSEVLSQVYAPVIARTPAQLEKLLTPEQWAVLTPFVQSKSSGVRLVPDAADPAGNSPTGGQGRNTAQDDFA